MKRVIVTGAAGALGEAVARSFLAAGHRVLRIARGPLEGPDALSGYDLSDPGAAEAAFAAASGALGGADVLINAAGTFRFEMVCGGDAATWDQMHAANLKTCANMCRAAASGLKDSGAIVNVGAAAAERAGAGMGPYASSKSAVARLTESLAAELGGRIRVNAVLPLILDTPKNRRDMPDAEPAQWTSLQAVVDVIGFLASEKSRAVNGALIPVTNAAR